jgi:hypothetical protein
VTQYTDNVSVEKLLTYGSRVATVTAQALAAATLNLTATSTETQVFTGSTADQVLKLPDATTLTNGWQFYIYNQSSAATIALQDSSGTLQATILPKTAVRAFLAGNTSAAGTWAIWQNHYGSMSGVVYSNINDITPFTTSSSTDTVVTSLSTTPLTGTYMVSVSAAWQNSDATAVMTASIYNNGTAVPDSVRAYQSFGAGKSGGLYTQVITTVDGLKALDLRVSTTAGTITINQRNMHVLRVGN